MISVEHVSKSYGPVKALDDVSFGIDQGQITGLLGPNGAGKTSAMRVITGYMEPDAGIVRVGEVTVADDPLKVKRSIGYLPESAPSYGDMLVYDYVYYVARVQGVDSPARVRDTIHLCGLTSVAHRPIRELSKGYRQRVGLAHALVHDPQILILDEPTTGLDPNQILEVRDLIRRISAEKTIVLSTHILQEVEALCDRVLILHRGTIHLDEKAESLGAADGVPRALRLKAKGPEPEQLEQWVREVPGVASVDAERSDPAGLVSCRVGADGTRDLRPELFRLAVDKGFQLYELSVETASLEEVFRQLTTEDYDDIG